MPVPSPDRASRRPIRQFAGYLLLPALLLLCLPLLARGPQPANRILLEPLGYQPPLSRYLLAGSSMLTLDYVDEKHLLLTFNTRRLIKRIPGDPPDDLDHTVDALLLELPDGKILARTEWRLHDHGPYVWNLGHGQFLLRIRNIFTTFAPVEHLNGGDSFLQRPFLHTPRHIVAVRLSASSDLLTIESTDPPPPPVLPLSTSIATAPPPTDVPPPPPGLVQLNFYRLVAPAPSHDFVVPSVAGVALTRHAVDLPLTAAGYLRALDEGKSRWAFDFKPHVGKTLELGLYDSSCRPYPSFVSASEFITFGCHGGTERRQLAGFNLRGDEMWEQALPGSYISPTLVYTPTHGRFALGRLLVTSAAIETDSLSPAEVSAQAVDVYQIDSGKTLLHVECTPASRAGQNFTFSPDGLNLAIIHADAIEIYALPALSSKDQAAIKLAISSAPQPADTLITLTDSASQPAQVNTEPTPLPAAATTAAQADPNPNPDASSTPTPAPTPTASTTPPTTPPTSSPSNQTPPTQAAPTPQQPEPSAPTTTDPAPDQPRKPPTLYNPPAPE